jgi:hypothetical protein
MWQGRYGEAFVVLIRVTAPHFCAGLEVERGVVVNAAPILKWTLSHQFFGSKLRPAILQELGRRGYEVEMKTDDGWVTWRKK